MKKFFELITLAALSTDSYFTVDHNGEAMYGLYKNILDDLTKKASNTEEQKPNNKLKGSKQR